jgi:FolB domain-containing protein
MDKIIIRDLRAHGVLGVYEDERRAAREIIIQLTLYTHTRRAARTDDLADTVDYAKMSKDVVALVEQSRCYTVEALAEDIARLCLAEPGVQKVCVRVEKPGAVKLAGSVGVEIERP